MATETVIIDRDYIDNFSVKEYCENTLIPKYFPDIDVSLRTVGMLGYVTELITNYGEDTFNTGSVLFRETFPNRAQVEESIYSHAAIFQLDYVFSTAAACKFLLVLDEETIIKTMVNYYDKDTGIYHFYIDKDTIIYIEDTPYSLDYDIQFDIIKKTSSVSDEYIFSAKYILTEYSNSLSEIVHPYIKVRRSSDGFMALEVQCHQCEREIYEEYIISNGTVNYPTVDIDYTENVAGFDVLYKSPTSDEYEQLETLLVYSQPLTTPFCYYQVIKSGKIRLSFNSKDNYFMPDFNSELKIIVYTTRGSGGNFESYTGNNIKITTNPSTYGYDESFLVAAKPIGSAANGDDNLGIDSLQALAVEGYRTALALTTENDLLQYFNNYKYRYGNFDVLFVKRRDDVYERIYTAFIIVRDGDYLFKTNTLSLKMNLSDMKLVEKDTYVLEPGWLFTSNTGDGYAYFLRDENKYDSYHTEYLLAVADGTIPYIEDKSTEIPSYLDRAASYAEFKRRKGIDDKINVFDLSKKDFDKYDNPLESKFLYMNPFLMYFKKSPNLLSTYMTFVRNSTLTDFINQNDDSFVQFTAYTINVNRAFSKVKKFEIDVTISTSVLLSDKYPVVHCNADKTEYIFDGKYDVVNNDLRVIMTIRNNNTDVCFIELYPTAYDSESSAFTFYGEIFTDDYISSDGRLKIFDGKVYRDDETGNYYKVYEDDATLYNLYDKDDNILATDIPVDVVTELYNEGKVVIWYNVHKMTNESNIYIPIEDVVCRIYTLYNRIYSEESGSLVPVTTDETNNIFYPYDSRYNAMIWTNEYSTTSNPITFMQSLNNVRSQLTFEDFTSYTESETGEKIYDYDIMDVDVKTINFLRAKTILDEDETNYLFTSYLYNYEFITDIINTRLRNCTNIDCKFYNTYGRSKNLIVGENNEKLDTVNIGLSFDMYFISGTDLLDAVPEVKSYIKEQIETINSDGMNNLYISNLMRKIETNFAYVDHIRFLSINNYDSTYQTIKSEVDDINDLSVEDRRYYIPELIVCDTDDITINSYFVQ